MREIRFRMWDEQSNYMIDWEDIVRSDILLPALFGKLSIPMQYTGLKDRKGVEIYEGDIIKHHDHQEPLPTGVVEWDEEDACFTVGIGTPSETQEWHEVIGNIYENPDLLAQPNKKEL